MTVQKHALKEPLWHPSFTTLTTRLPAQKKQSLIAALSYKNSMTAHITQLFKTPPTLQPTHQGWQTPQHSEAQALQLTHQDSVWIREVVLSIQNNAYMFARSVFPPETLEGKQGQTLLSLGNKPLGPLLFKNPSLKRTPFDYASLTPDHYEWQATQEALAACAHDTPQMETHTPIGVKTLWARRSVFFWQNKPILLTEIFLPFLFTLDFPNYDN